MYKSHIIDVKSKSFNEKFYYEGNDLGCTYSKEKSILKVWAPLSTDVKCQIVSNGVESIFSMTLEDKGVWSLVLEGDYEGTTYVYHVYFGKHLNIATDPYALASTPNHERTCIIDREKTKINNRKECLEPLRSYTDAIIYELHIRDFSVDINSGIAHKGEFLGLTEEGTVTSNGKVSGIDYIKSLGITHVQLLPVYDFGSVDEHRPFDTYNWGYDPVQYNLPEGSYGSDILDPYSRIIELKKAIAHLHTKGIRVIMDVVYNHMFDKETSAFEKIVPGYYFRTDALGNASNGSFCGNDLDSTKPMVRKFFLESTRLWIEDYGFDGFRFDLMGILDINTMNAIAEQTLVLDSNAMIYGEGWNMPTFLEDKDKAIMMNHEKMPMIAHFSDIFREKIKGGTLEYQFHESGYGSGGVEKSLDAMHLLLGTVMKTENKGEQIEPYFVEPTHTVNYVECHDNHTLWDKLEISLPDESEELRIKRHKFITTLVLLSQGIPFLHGGQEFLRSKGGEHNSYKSSDDINMLRWLQKDKYQDVVDYVKDVITLRKTYPEFRLSTKEAIESYTQVYANEDHCVVYNLFALEDNCGYIGLKVVINPNIEPVNIVLDSMSESHTLILNQYGLTKKSSKKQEVTIEPLEVCCFICK